MKARLELVGVLWMVWSAFVLLAGVAAGLVFLGFGGVLAFLPSGGPDEPPGWFIGGIFGGLGAVLGMVFGGLGLIGVVAGWYTRKGREWAKVVLAILSVTQLGQVPIGTVLALATWALLFLPAPPTGPADPHSPR